MPGLREELVRKETGLLNRSLKAEYSARSRPSAQSDPPFLRETRQTRRDSGRVAVQSKIENPKSKIRLHLLPTTCHLPVASAPLCLCGEFNDSQAFAPNSQAKGTDSQAKGTDSQAKPARFRRFCQTLKELGEGWRKKVHLTTARVALRQSPPRRGAPLVIPAPHS